MSVIKNLLSAILSENSTIKFYELEFEICKFLKQLSQRGLTNPRFASIEISINEQYNVSFEVFYKSNKNDNYIVENKAGTFTEILDIPPKYRTLLEEKKKLKFEIKDFYSILSLNENKLLKKINFLDIDNYFEQFISKYNNITIVDNTITITDDIFKTTVKFEVNCSINNKPKTISKVYEFMDINKMPIDIANKLSKNGSVAFKIENNSIVRNGM